MTTPLEDEHPEPVTVFESSDPAAIGVAESLLEEAEIEFFAQGEGIQDLFGGGRIAFNPIVGPVRLQVAAEDADEARAALAELTKPNAEPDVDQ
jgi:hypothetical protein